MQEETVKIPDKLKVFSVHGVTFRGKSGNQFYGDCPFSDKSGKFYVNEENGLWDSKTASLSGNITKFLSLIVEQNQRNVTETVKTRLVRDRKLPWEAFEGYGIGWDGIVFTLPVYDAKKKLVDVRRYRPGKRIQTTSGQHPGLLGAPGLPGTKDPVYLCEGEWDAIAMAWLLKKLKKPGAVVGVPGAGMFRQDWVPWFKDRVVHVMYDNDKAGEDGEHRVIKMIGEVARQLKFVRWSDNLFAGFDVRDWIVYGAVERDKAKGCFDNLMKMMVDEPRRAFDGATNGTPDDDEEEEVPTRHVNFAEVENTFRKWLYLKDTQAIEISLASAISIQIEGDPIWLFLVAPPGGAKTETLTALSSHRKIYVTSSLTPHSLISGLAVQNGRDPSLIPKLDKKILVIKDFTSILGLRDQEKDEIFGILRDAYDGKCSKAFGNGITRSYSSRFSILAAVTPRIYELSNQHTSLGERFLKFCTGDPLVHFHEDDIIMRAIENVNSETTMRSELQDVCKNFLLSHQNISIPAVPRNILLKIVELAKFGARLRGNVVRDSYRSEMIAARPTAEVGSRLGKQLAKLAMSIAIVHDRKEVTNYEYNLVKKTVLDTISQRVEDIVCYVWKNCPTRDDSRSSREISEATRYPHVTVARVMADLHLLDVVEKAGAHNSFRWTLTPYMRDCITRADLYTSVLEETRPRMRTFIYVRKKRKKSGGKVQKLRTRVVGDSVQPGQGSDERLGGAKRTNSVSGGGA